MEERTNKLKTKNAKQPRNCKPETNFIFNKPYKTGGGAVGALLYRYGLKHNLIAAFPADPTSSVIESINGSEVLVFKYPCVNRFPVYNYISNHIRDYNYTLFKQFIPKAKFITMARLPFRQMESLFYWNYLHISLGLQNFSNPFETFLTNINYRKNVDRFVKSFLNQLGHNEIKDLEKRLLAYDKEYDLVMITEYMEESLLLLKQMMCWTFDDIVYYSQKISGRKPQHITSKMEEVLAYKLSNDIRFYDYFNKTLWHKIHNYNGNFENDLNIFRSKQMRITERCSVKQYNDEPCDLLRMDVTNYGRLIREAQFNTFC
ncbi:galactosylceramide sulfotransferase-like [Saccoglossus kowalevskii]|uniref:Galactosylceramide sulfotransferase-like n=1 Tax=Saccoglossus kowalevskii TaxID=10224 RepID=A0ABM0ME81_SACKO|nr:PREDICTED: galactosylceramide sulfotransferase-like [Saccoglossus kowalevskii]